MLRHVRVLLVLGPLAAAFGCSAAPKKKVKEPTFQSKHKAVNPLVDRKSNDDGMKVSGLMGTLDPAAVQRAMGRTFPAATQCYHRVSRTQPYVGGAMNMKFRVRRDGSIKTLTLLSSDVGSLEIERCVLEKLGQTRFDRPRGGGEAEFTYPMTFPTRLQALEWKSERVRKTLNKWRGKRKNRKALAKLSFPRELVLTLYINGDGKLASAGMVAAEAIDATFAKELVAQLKTVRFEQPPTRIAKVSYRW